MDAQDLSVNFDHIEPETLLENWEWLIGISKLPALITALGDVFLQDIEDGSVYFLNTATAELSQVAVSMDQFVDKLSNDEFIHEYFAVPLISQLKELHGDLPEGCVYSFKQLPAQGGSISADNVVILDIEEHFSMTGNMQQL